MLAVLFLVGVFGLMDRSILAVLLEPIRIDLAVSDAAMGVLTGFAFVLFYTLTGLPIARLADTYSRRAIIAAGLTFWSVLTSLSGFARTFWQLALARVGVGVGEATYFAPGLSLLSDYFPSARRTFAVSVFAVSTQLGLMASLLLGGWLGTRVGWRLTLLWLGVPGLVLALLVRLTVPEPVRGDAEEAGSDVTLYDVRTTVAYIWNQRAFRHVVLGGALSLLALASLLVWSPAFLMRVHSMDLMQAAASLGLPTGVLGATGVLLGGGVAQRLARRDARWLLGVPALTALLGVPFVLLFLFLTDRATAVPMYLGVALFAPAFLGPVMTATQLLAKVRMRALAAALANLVVNLIGGGLGPLLVGALSDRLGPALGAASLRYALLTAAAAMAWAALHLVLATRHLRADLARSAA